MKICTQYLDKNWYACPERTEIYDQEAYCRGLDANTCTPTNIPALVSELFPLEESSIWYYTRFFTEMKADNTHRIYINFDRVVSLCEVWINGIFVGSHFHSEEAFSFDVSDVLRDGENLLACRVYGPVFGKVGPQGIAMDTVPNFAHVYAYYVIPSKTGIYPHVSLTKEPRVKIINRLIRPDPFDGSVAVEVTLQNLLDDPADGTVTVTFVNTGSAVCEDSLLFSLVAGEKKTVRALLKPPSFELWSPDNPKLYTMNIALETICGKTTYSDRFGYKDLRIKDGYFHLNGKRIFLVSAHAIQTKEAVIHAKTMGFQALRFLTEMPSSELLDYCDEVGMMVYEECAVAWGMSDYPGMEVHVREYLNNMILRDRNHVCVGIWGIFNEQPGPNKSKSHPRIPETSKVFETAVSYLPMLRKSDPSRLILLSSGRWDARADIGSYSNPGSDQWEYGWGAEGPLATSCAPGTDSRDLDPYMTLMGDNHLYPTVPIQKEVRDFIRKIGTDTKPVYISEYGVGYQLVLHDLYTDLTSYAHPEQPKIRYYKTQIEKLDKFIAHYDLGHVYPTARDFLMASVFAGAKQRAESIDPIRANPRLCGYGLTSFSIGNEGVYYREGGFIPGLVDVLRDSFAPLKWAFFMDHTQLYSHTPFNVEAVLCNTDVLVPGPYTADVSVRGEDGVCWSQKTAFYYPDDRPLAASVMSLGLPGFQPGNYTLSVYVSGIRQPTCNTLQFRVHDTSFDKIRLSFFPIGNLGKAESFLQSIGASTVSDGQCADIICVGTILPDEKNAVLNSILTLASGGKTVVILDDGIWENVNTSDQEFMGSIRFSYDDHKTMPVNFGNRLYIRNWLYHMDNYIADSKIFSGLAYPGLLDMDMFRLVYPDHYMVNPDKPAKTYCAAYGSGMFVENGCLSALTMGEFMLGSGKIVINTFKLLDNIGRDPVADRLLYNIITAL